MLVQQIVEVQPAESLPFYKIEFSHPQIKKQTHIKRRPTDRQRNRKDVSEYQIYNEAKPPSISNSFVSLPSINISILESKKIQVTQAGSVSIINSENSTDPSNSENPNLPINQLVNISDVGKDGKITPAEFVFNSRIDIFVYPTDGLDEFAEAIKFLDEIYSAISVSWKVRELQEDIIFANINGKRRKYALVKLTFSSGYSCWILEFGRPDDFSISTILFAFNDVTTEDASDFYIGKILTKALLPQGGWLNQELNKLRYLDQLKFKLCKHISSSTEDWSIRLYKNAKKIT